MNNKILNKICYFIHTPEKLLSCCKKFTVKRFSNIRWKNRVYFKDGKIKRINKFLKIKKEEIWYKNGVKHQDNIDPKTGFTLPAIFIEKVNSVVTQEWYRDGEKHRDDKDPVTNLTLPAYIHGDYDKTWYKDGKKHRDDKDPETGLTLYAVIKNTPAVVITHFTKEWWINGLLHRDEKDPFTKKIMPAKICSDSSKEWWKDGKKYRKTEVIDNIELEISLITNIPYYYE